ncbi:HNH endonuclease signature motif containing protein [Microbacterium sp. NC79]|uniref:HNH endonuclease signature motif containing protein n=1 Tax=Microbacterium sp. NC79 TaxID=2851009 RepID=UPI001C2CAEA8|nr:HNH endonuclease signature motif containing protein [Microbacterium sp. NC79]MBV0896084.1 HNH endonuclease [Microbacterium sp. NC79]
MALLTDVAALIPTLCGHGTVGGAPASAVAIDEDAVAASSEMQSRMLTMNDAEIHAVMHEASMLERQAAHLRQIATGIASARSSRQFGHDGLAAKRGHRSAVSLVQEVMGVSQAEAARQVRVSEALVDAAGSAALPDSAISAEERELESVESSPDCFVAPPPPWHQPLNVALRAEHLSSAQYDAIKNGLGEPPLIERDAEGRGVGAGGVISAAEADAFDAQAREAWSAAVEVLIDEAPVSTVHDLHQHARTMRDQLDPEGAQRRFDERYEARSFRLHSLDNGATRASWILDDETALFIASIQDAALRPRRGGPRFVDSAERAQAAELSADPRSNAQLAHDLMVDILRAGVLAESKTVFGTRQAGVRLVQVIDGAGERANIAHTEDRLVSLPGGVADQRLCDSESVHVTVDSHGNPLDLGRAKRMFSAAQKIALSIRDGGCRWTNCDRPASYCEAHHIDPWSEGGTTDADRGIMLCQHHHMNLHNGGWRITREGKGEFMLTHPDHPPRTLPPKAPLEYAWLNVTLPRPRFRPAERADAA